MEKTRSSGYEILPLAFADESAGGKALGLKKLAALGLRTPETFVVKAGRNGDFAASLSGTYDALGKGDVAVRSSAMGEDGRTFSAAGQYETFLDVRGIEAVQEAINRCLDSGRSHRVREYYNHRSGGGDGAGIAVILQRMVRAEKAGVLFTADPVTGDEEICVIETAEGKGEGLMGGFVRGERYMVDKRNGAVLSKPDGGLLSIEVIRDLMRDALIAEKAWGGPLDMEWAVDDDGVLHWLQARPVTALGADSLDTPVADDEILTRCNIGEMLPGAATPLTLSVFVEPLDWGMREMYRRMGVLRGVANPPRYINHIHNHLFMNLSSMYIMARKVAGASPEAIELNVIGKVLPPHDIGPAAPELTRLSNGIRYALRILGHNRYLRKIRRIGLNFRISTEGKTAKEIYADLRKLQQTVLNDAYYCHYLVSAYSGVMNGILSAILSGGKQVTTEALAAMGTMLTNITDIESADLLRSLQAVADAIRRSVKNDWFVKAPDTEALDWLRGTQAGIAGEKFKSFLARHGHRCIREAELRSRDYETYPEEVIVLLREVLRNAGSEKREEDAPPESALRIPKWLLNKAKEGVRQREYSKSMLILTQHQFKKAYRELAAKLKDRETLPDADLVYFFKREELGELIDGGNSPDLIRRAEARRRELPYQMELWFPEISRGKPIPGRQPSVEGNHGDVIQGTPVSAGLVEGPVRVILKAEQANELKSGEIMVARFTDIGWTPLYGSISGLVTEIGGALSHGAVVAREYGLPMVSNVPGLTSTLKTGMRIRMDGKKGTITVL